jgi:hypothetical protein
LPNGGLTTANVPVKTVQQTPPLVGGVIDYSLVQEN